MRRAGKTAIECDGHDRRIGGAQPVRRAVQPDRKRGLGHAVAQMDVKQAFDLAQ